MYTSLVIYSIFIILAMVTCRHYSRIIGIILTTPCTLLHIYYSFTNRSGILSFICVCLATLVLLAALTFCYIHFTYDWSRRIYSLTYLLNVLLDSVWNNKNSLNNGDRIIGKVLPYNNYQLKWNGKNIVANAVALSGNTLVSGASGSGKTYELLSMIRQNIHSGNSVIFAEFKGDPDVIEKIIYYAQKHDYKIFSSLNGVSNFNYDPLLHLNNSGRIEAIMNMRKWSLDGSDAHYKTGTQLLLQKTMKDFSHKWLSMENSGMTVGQSFTMSYYSFLCEYHPAYGEQDSWSTIVKLLELMITSSLSPMFQFKNDFMLDFSEIKNEKFLMVVSFTSSNKELATSFSSLMFRDILDECTVEQPTKNIYLYVDEFGTLENPFIIKDIVEKGRSAHIATTISLQDINQIVIQTNEAYLNALLGTLNSFIIFSGATRVTAEKFAGVQLADIEMVIMNLRKPLDGKTPTAIYISKYPSLNKRINSEVYRFEPFIFDEDMKEKRQKEVLDGPMEKEKIYPDRPQDLDDFMKQESAAFELSQIQPAHAESLNSDDEDGDTEYLNDLIFGKK